jgi:hypothetical protein
MEKSSTSVICRGNDGMGNSTTQAATHWWMKRSHPLRSIYWTKGCQKQPPDNDPWRAAVAESWQDDEERGRCCSCQRCQRDDGDDGDETKTMIWRGRESRTAGDVAQGATDMKRGAVMESDERDDRIDDVYAPVHAPARVSAERPRPSSRALP